MKPAGQGQDCRLQPLAALETARRGQSYLWAVVSRLFHCLSRRSVSSRRQVAALLVLAALGLWCPAPARAQPRPPLARYWVTLTDKTGVRFHPSHYFSPAARARRARQHLPAADATDWPLRPDYLAAIRAAVDTVTLVSRWFNAVSCRATPAQAARLRGLPGVRAVAAWPLATGGAAFTSPPVPLSCGEGGHLLTRVSPEVPEQAFSAIKCPPSPQERGTGGEVNAANNQISPDDYLLARRQTSHLDGPALRRAGLDGRGLRIAVFDVGFNGLDLHPAFQQLWQERRVVATYDFLKHREDVFHGGGHGTEVMGCLAGRLPASADGQPGPALGLAPAAEYLLARTEQLRRESYGEEEAWLAAAEWADRLGADIINSSLAYTEQRYFPEDMTGRRSLIARAANLAARKGILVVSAAGNDGDNDWVRIGTPADADSVLAIGGLDPETGLHVDFSSFGPTADRRPKPNLAAYGIVLTTTPGGGYERLEGTSFSSPLLAGFAACVWQQRRDVPAMQLFRQLQQAGELYPYFDYAHGYGRPRAAPFLAAPAPAAAPTFDFVPHDSLVAVVVRPAAATRPAQTLPLLLEQPDAAQATVLGQPEAAKPNDPVPPDPARVGHEQPLPDPAPLAPEVDYPPYLYWEIADRRGVLRRYETRAVQQRLVVQVPRRLLRGGDVLRVHFKGFTGTYSE